MKTTQYVRQERAIAAADTGGIRERWMFGLRLLRDPEAIAKAGGLRHGVTDQLVAAVTAAGRKLSAREIRYRLQCARTYPTEAQIRQATAEFETWTALIDADFPAFDAPEGEPLADHRTEAERDRDRARALLELIGEQAALFPLDQFEPVTTPLKELVEHTEQMEGLTERFRQRDLNRRAYVDRLVEAADGDLSMPWLEAHGRLGTGEELPS